MKRIYITIERNILRKTICLRRWKVFQVNLKKFEFKRMERSILYR